MGIAAAELFFVQYGAVIRRKACTVCFKSFVTKVGGIVFISFSGFFLNDERCSVLTQHHHMSVCQFQNVSAVHLKGGGNQTTENGLNTGYFVFAERVSVDLFKIVAVRIENGGKILIGL